jgi:hypothetical protein
MSDTLAAAREALQSAERDIDPTDLAALVAEVRRLRAT